MLLLNTLGTGDEKRPEQMNRWIDLLDMMQPLQGQVLEIGSRGGERGVGKAFSVKKGGIAEDFGDVEELDTVEVA